MLGPASRSRPSTPRQAASTSTPIPGPCPLQGEGGRRLALVALSLVLSLLALPAFAAPTFPALTGRVVDNAHMLSPATQADLTRKLEALESQTGHQLVVVTVPDLGGLEIEDYGYRLGREWGIGQKKINDGVLLIVAPNQRKVRIEVGYGLEGVLTDALSSVILQTAVLPKFRAGDMEGGVVAGTDALIQQLSLPEDQARAVVDKAAEAPVKDGDFPIPVIIILFIVVFILVRMVGGRRRGGCLGGALPWIIAGNASNWGSGGGSGWSGGGGGGFSGGGGSFGGGGSSGGW
ncbi:MAG: methanol dehydrogenase [Caulobacter sp.]|nr:methanol dehydrogenase [Caulobacter sp.]